MNANVDPDRCAALAAEFGRVLIEWLGTENVAKVVAANAQAADGSCASHDYCDANMAMETAFDLQHLQVDNALWNAAWQAWKDAATAGVTK